MSHNSQMIVNCPYLMHFDTYYVCWFLVSRRCKSKRSNDVLVTHAMNFPWNSPGFDFGFWMARPAFPQEEKP